MVTAPLIKPAHHIINCDQNSIFVLSLVLMQFAMFAIGKTNAALPIKTNEIKVETATEVPMLALLFSILSMSSSKTCANTSEIVASPIQSISSLVTPLEFSKAAKL